MALETLIWMVVGARSPLPDRILAGLFKYILVYISLVIDSKVSKVLGFPRGLKD